MKSKSHITGRTKKILLGTGIVFGTVLVFIISFFLSFSLIVNPISFVPVGNGEMAEENEELKKQVQTLEDEVELLNTTVEKYKNSASVSASVPETPTVTTPAPNKTQQQTTSANTAQGQGSGAEGNKTENASQKEENSFSAETAITPESGIEDEAEPDITVIDISE